jgi:hypothetical protein
MATKTRSMFGEDKPVQRNKESRGGDEKPNRSPGQSNAARAFPSVKEDVGKSVSEDVRRIRTGMEPTGKSELTRSAQQNAGGRAVTRMASRAGYAGAALEAGYAAGRKLDEETGVGKKAVNNSQVLKEVASKLSKSDRVELSKASKERLADIENDEALRKVDSEKEYAKGGYVNCGASVPPAQKAKNGSK